MANALLGEITQMNGWDCLAALGFFALVGWVAYLIMKATKIDW